MPTPSLGFTTLPQKAHCTNEINWNIAPFLPVGGAAGEAGDTPTGGGLVSNRIFDRPKIYANIRIMSGGVVLKRRGLSSITPPPIGRGVICGFSAASRRRMSHKLMELDWSLLMPSINGRNYASFTTLTYPDNFSDDRERWKRDLHTLTKRLDRYYPGNVFIWKMEMKKRKSGENKGKVAPHFHLLAYFQNGIELPEFRQFLSLAWFEVVGSNDEKHLRAGTQAAPLYGTVGKLMAYCAKYLGKDFQVEFETGRCWGQHGIMPVGEVYSFDIDYIEFCRRVRRWGKASPYLRSRLCPKGMMIFGSVAQLTNGLLVSGVSPPDVLYRDLVTKKTIATLKEYIARAVKRREANALVVAEFQARYPAKGGEV